METKLYQTKITVDGHCLDLLLTETELVEAHARATLPANLTLLGDNCCSCWPVERTKCGLWDRLLHRCDCENTT